MINNIRLVVLRPLTDLVFKNSMLEIDNRIIFKIVVSNFPRMKRG